MTSTDAFLNQPLAALNSRATPTRLDAIGEPGAYLCHWSGHLLRVTNEDINIGSHPTISVTANKPLWVSKISEDPAISLGQARIMTANLDLPVNF